jgi:6-phosphogluconolactonase
MKLSGNCIPASRRSFLAGAAATLLTPTIPAIAAGDGRTPATAEKRFAYAGTSTGKPGAGGNGEGIYCFEMNYRTGVLSGRKLVAEGANPWWLTVDASGKYLYAIGSSPEAKSTSGVVDAFSIDRRTGGLRHLNTVSSCGAGPAHLSIDRSGKYLLVANYDGGSIAVLPIHDNGELGPATDTHRDVGSLGKTVATNAPPGSFAWSGHDAPHAHMILADPANRFVLYTDLGQDRIYVYRFDHVHGRLTPASSPFVSLPPGDGPRHLAFHPNGAWLYSIQEEASTIALFHYDSANGALSRRQMISTLPEGFAGTSFASEVLTSKDGRFLYAANRLHDTISIFSIGSGGSLSFLGETSTLGDYPSQFNIDPSGSFLYCCNQHSDAITSFHIHRDTGRLTFTGQYTAVGTPGCIVFL